MARCRAPWPLCSNAEPQELRHGGGSSAGLALLPSPFLELWAHSRRTRFLPEVNMRRGRGSAEPRSPLSPSILSLCLFSPPTSLFTFVPRFLPPTAKKPRAPPGCIPEPERLWSPATGKLQVRAHAPSAREGYPRVTAEGEMVEEGEYFFSLQQSNSLPPTPPPPPTGGSFTRAPSLTPAPPPLILHLDTLRRSF